MHNKLSPSKQRRKKSVRRKIAELGKHRLTVFRTATHIYAQVFTSDGSQVLASASSLEKPMREKQAGEKGKVSVAEHVGQLIAERATAKGIKDVAFDRSGFKYHGRVKAVADGARNGGLEF